MIMRRNGLSDDQERNPLHLAGSQPSQRTPFPEIAGLLEGNGTPLPGG